MLVERGDSLFFKMIIELLFWGDYFGLYRGSSLSLVPFWIQVMGLVHIVIYWLMTPCVLASRLLSQRWEHYVPWNHTACSENHNTSLPVLLTPLPRGHCVSGWTSRRRNGTGKGLICVLIEYFASSLRTKILAWMLFTGCKYRHTMSVQNAAKFLPTLGSLSCDL